MHQSTAAHKRWWTRTIGEKSAYAKWWLGGGIAIQILAFWAGTLPGGVSHSTSWTNRGVAAAFSLVGLLVAAALMHVFDARRSGKTIKGTGYGVRYLYYKVDSKHRLDDNVISGVLSRESIQGAITLGILAALVGEVKIPASFVELLRDPRLLFPAAIIAALGLSVVTTLAGLLCYDYSSRFDWGNNSDVRNMLISKGHNLGQVGFYSLMWSLAAAPILRSYSVCMLSVLVVFVVMWYYYFFSTVRVNNALGDHKRADMVGVDLHGKDLRTNNFNDADLSGADLRNANLKRARLAKTLLKGAHVEGADLSNSDVSEEQMKEALGDMNTKLPEGVHRPPTWPEE